jgi:hypothetical protein
VLSRQTEGALDASRQEPSGSLLPRSRMGTLSRTPGKRVGMAVPKAASVMFPDFPVLFPACSPLMYFKKTTFPVFPVRLRHTCRRLAPASFYISLCRSGNTGNSGNELFNQ